MIKNCIICKKEFKTYLCFVKKGYGKYCSHKCYTEAAKQGKYPKRGYQKGHKGFNTGKTWFKKGTYQGYGFQKGHKTWNKGKRFFQISGEKHHNWKGGISSKMENIRHSLEMKCWERIVTKRDDYTCQKCREIFTKKKLTAHHIQNFSEYPKLIFAIDNGITFCRKCHKLFHKIYGYKNNNKEQIIQFLN